MKFSRQIFIKKQSKFCKLLVHKLQKRDFIGLVHSSLPLIAFRHSKTIFILRFLCESTTKVQVATFKR